MAKEITLKEVLLIKNLLGQIENCGLNEWTNLSRYINEYQKIYKELYDRIDEGVDYTMSKEYYTLEQMMPKTRYSQKQKKSAFDDTRKRLVRDIEVPFALVFDKFQKEQ